jgi:hypothetical protein
MVLRKIDKNINPLKKPLQMFYISNHPASGPVSYGAGFALPRGCEAAVCGKIVAKASLETLNRAREATVWQILKSA